MHKAADWNEPLHGKQIEKMSPELDTYRRFDWGIPPTSKGDYAFVMHMLHSLDDTTGRMGIILPHGVLFRGASEGRIRRTIIENFNLLKFKKNVRDKTVNI